MLNKDNCSTCHGVALIEYACEACGIQFDESKLPPNTPLHKKCPNCNQSTSWHNGGKTPVDSTDYCQQVYKQNIYCGHCNFNYTRLEPCQLRPL